MIDTLAAKFNDSAAQGGDHIDGSFGVGVLHHLREYRCAIAWDIQGKEAWCPVGDAVFDFIVDAGLNGRERHEQSKAKAKRDDQCLRLRTGAMQVGKREARQGCLWPWNAQSDSTQQPRNAREQQQQAKGRADKGERE